MTDRTWRSRGLEDRRVPENREHRRQTLRFEVLGRMAGSVASIETLHPVNLGTGGALVESALPLPPNAELTMQLVLDGYVSETTVKIRRVIEIRREDGALRYRIGLEFQALSAETEQVIHEFVNVNQAHMTSGGLGTMTPSVPERRRSVRAAVGANSWLALPSTWPVQLLDLSFGGVALASPYDLEPGRSPSVRVTFGGQAFNSKVRVCWSRRRTAISSNRPGFDIGACFVSLEAGSRLALESFLNPSAH
jgi:PilZ domain